MGGQGGRGAFVVGAGASGRGHVGQLAFESGYHLAFLDKDRALCDLLRSRGRYEVNLVSAHPRSVTVEGFSVFHVGQMDAAYPSFAEAELLLTTVCPPNLREAADELRPLFVRWLRDSGGIKPKNVLCCENMSRGTSVFRGYLEEGFPPELRALLERSVGFADTMIARVVTRPRDPLALLGEEYSEWTADSSAIRGPAPDVRTLKLVEKQARYLERKLYIHNTGHATLGYLGFLRGFRYVHESAQDPDIMAVCEAAIEESGWAVEREHGFAAQTIRAYRKALTDKCVLPQLPDELERVVRDPLRKLGPEERFFGPIGLLTRYGREPRWLLYGAAAAMLARIPGDAQSERIHGILEDDGVSAVLRAAGVHAPEGVVRAIESLIPEVQSRFARRPGSRA